MTYDEAYDLALLYMRAQRFDDHAKMEDCREHLWEGGWRVVPGQYGLWLFRTNKPGEPREGSDTYTTYSG